MADIKFGTDGWRAIIADDYTFENVRKVALAFARHYRRHPKIDNGVVIGGDARFGSQEFAAAAAQVIASQGIRVWLAEDVVSTPMLSLGIIKKRAAAGVMITASHNPPEWNGFKIKADFGGSALMKDIKKVEKLLAGILEKNTVPRLRPVKELRDAKLIAPVNLMGMYLTDIRRKINLDRIEKSGMRIAYDVMYGASFGQMGELLPSVYCLHDEHNPGFKGIAPEPLEKNLAEFIALIRKEKYDIGLVTDGDVDRFGCVDEHGNYISTQLLIPILLKYLHKDLGKTGAVVKTVSVTDIVTRMCEKYGLELYERPVGFKYITELLLEKNVLIGGEESGGVGTSLHIPERDGIFNNLLLCEALAKKKLTLGQAVEEIFEEFGRVYYDRIDFRTTEKNKSAILAACERGMDKIGTLTVHSVETIDGYKFRVDGGWLLIRASGTEPILRFYAEADSERTLKTLLKAAVGMGK
ncbi:MAG: phosphoglucomutase/phosphomannomutase family protein [Bacteroidetes bacterium]|nr:phosphoglucomutase/phosphomannomutase family protein [Bacteroidota bacterium]